MTSTCTVCENSVSGNYCSHCGQWITNKKARTWTLILDFFGNFFSVDKSFIGTSRKLLSKPQYIVENFLYGNKRFYQSPGSFLIYGLTLIAIHSIIIGPNLWGVTFDLEGVGMQYAVWTILLPLLILSSYFTFIRQGYHLSKHIISLSYLSTVFLFIFLIIDDIIVYLSLDLTSDIFMFLFFIFTFVWNSFVFSKKQNFIYHIINTFVQLLIFSGLFLLLVLLVQNNSGK